MDEITALRARIAEIEARALRDAPRIGLETALSDHYSPARAPVDPARRRLESVARGFRPDPSSEAALRARAKDPAAYDAEMRRVGVGSLELSFYAVGREAAIALGTFTPTTPEGDAS